MTLEYKTSSDASDVKRAMSDFLGAFEAFKDANNERLDALEAKKAVDVITDEKVERLNRAIGEQKSRLDKIALNASRPHLDGGAAPVSEHKAAFSAYMRSGETRALSSFDTKAMYAGSDADGGYLAPEETERVIDRVLKAASPMRSIASVRRISANEYQKPIATSAAASGWVAETAIRPETSSPQFSLTRFPTMELYAMPSATQNLLDDSVVDLEEWLADEIQSEFAIQEDAAFLTGNGTTQPKGLLDYTKTAEASHSWGEVGYIATGATGDFSASDAPDTLIDLIYTPRQGYRANGRFVMNKNVAAQVRKFKDADGNYLWRPGQTAGDPATLLGYPVTESENMPDIAPDSYSIAFGDFERGYLIVDRAGVRILRDPFSAKPYVLFYTTKRVGGGVQDFNAIKLLKFATS